MADAEVHWPSSPPGPRAGQVWAVEVELTETLLDAFAGRFFRERIFSPGRTELLAAQLPATDTEAQARRDADAAALAAQIRKLSAQQDAQITALEDIPAGSPAGREMRARINTRFAELHTQRTDAETRLAALTSYRPQAADPAILEEIPYAGDILPALPADLKARLFDVFDLGIVWNRTSRQATVTAVITDNTLQALPGILDPGQDGYHDTVGPQPSQAPASGTMKELAQTPITPQNLRALSAELNGVARPRHRARGITAAAAHPA